MVIDAFLACLFNVHYLIFLSMVHEYAYFYEYMNIFENRSINEHFRFVVTSIVCYHCSIGIKIRDWNNRSLRTG